MKIFGISHKSGTNIFDQYLKLIQVPTYTKFYFMIHNIIFYLFIVSVLNSYSYDFWFINVENINIYELNICF